VYYYDDDDDDDDYYYYYYYFCKTIVSLLPARQLATLLIYFMCYSALAVKHVTSKTCLAVCVCVCVCVCVSVWTAHLSHF